MPVNIIEFLIRDKYGKIAGYHIRNLLYVHNTQYLFAFIPADEYTIHPYGYDENNEYWEGESMKLNEWLEKNK